MAEQKATCGDCGNKYFNIFHGRHYQYWECTWCEQLWHIGEFVAEDGGPYTLTIGWDDG